MRSVGTRDDTLHPKPLMGVAACIAKSLLAFMPSGSRTHSSHPDSPKPFKIGADCPEPHALASLEAT